MVDDLLLPDAGGVEWSVCVRDVGPGSGSEGTTLAEVGAGRPLRTASVGKVLLLLEAARALEAGEVHGDEPLTRSLEQWVGDSGLWHTLSVEALPLVDVAALVGALSDNLATNVLLERLGLDAVARLATRLGLRDTALHDRVRDERTGEHAPTLSTGSAVELCTLAVRVQRGDAVSPAADARVRAWLSANVDQSMVGSMLVEHRQVDPLAHHHSVAGPVRLWNKTGTDTGVRADVGTATAGGRSVAWAAVANWTPSRAGHDDLVAWSVLRGLRRVGDVVLDALG